MSAIVRETSEYVEMSDSITLCIVKDGAAGTSINMKTGVSSPDALPSSGASIGDSYIIDGHLWTYTGGTASDATHRNGFTDCGKVSGEAGKNNYVHVAWSNKQNPTKDDIVLSNTDGNAYAYMGTWVSETKEDTADEAVKMAKWVYVKGDKGTPGKDAVTYGVQVTPYLDPLSSGKTDPGIQIQFTRTTGATVETFTNVTKLGGLVMVYVDGVYHVDATNWINSGNDKIVFSHFPIDNTSTDKTLGTASTIGIKLLVNSSVVATANYSNGKQGDGVVMAYKHADTQPDAPTGTDPEYPGDGWSLSPDAATAGEKVTDVRYGGYESGTYDGTNKGTDATAKEWAEAEDDGRTWMKSPSGLSGYGYALMKVSFITQYDNTRVDVEIKAYSEQNFDLVEVWALDTAPSTGTSFRGQGLAHASGNGVEQAYSFTVAKAGRHFICVTYAKDTSVDNNGDYGLFRLDLSDNDNEVAVSDTVWMSQAKVSGGKCVLPWSTPVKINGADGSGALEISVDPDTLVFDTDDDGIVPSETSKRATIACYRDGKKVTNVDYALMEGGHPDCDASISASNGTATVTISNIAKDETYDVSKTSGTVEVQVYDKDKGRNYFPRVKFSVNVAKFNGGLKADNKKLQSQYSLLTNNGTVTDLKEYKSEILQTAKEISLKMSEKSVGRRNLLPGSALRKQDEGVELNLYGNTSNGEGIVVNDGINGVNALKVTTKSTNQFTGLFWRANASKSQQVKIKRNTKYTASVWVKCSNTNCSVQIECIYHASANDKNRISQVFRTVNYPTLKAGEWQLFTAVFSTGADYDYMECNFWATSASGTTVLFCKPMLEEGEEYNGWTLSEQDYDYVGGNLLDGTGTLTKTGNVEVLDETTVTQGGYNNESASVKAILQPTWKEYDFLRYSTTDMGLNVGEDCMLSFYARAASGYAHGELQCYLYDPSTGIVMTESSHEKLDFLWNPGDGDLHTHITPPTAWKRYWVHWRPMGNVPQHVLFCLLRPGTDQGSYDSSTSYNVGDVVLYGGTYYVCQKAGSGYEPGASSYWEATEFAIEIARPKLEVGATMTEWTEKRADMVDKRALFATGIDIENKKITLTANNTKFRDNDGNDLAVIDHDGLRAARIATTDKGQGHTVIEDNTTVWFQKDGKTPGIAVFYDASGVPHLAFYGTDGKQKYDIGPSGLQSLISSIQQAHSDTAYLRDATSYVYVNNSTLKGFKWLYVASGEKNDMRYIYRKQIPTTDASKNHDIYDGCVFTKEYSGMNWPNGGNLLPNGWYVKPNDGQLPIKRQMVDDPTPTLYCQTFYYYEGGKVARTVRAYMKRNTYSDLLDSKFEYAGSYEEILIF